MTPFAGINRVTSTYGYREYWKDGKLVQEIHRGMDVVPTAFPGEVLPENAWVVREVTGGTVLRVSYDASRGNYIDIQTAPGIFERYQHMDTIALATGEFAAQGTAVGVAGNTGNSTGRHLHFGVYRGGSRETDAINPQQWLGLPNEIGTYPGNNDYGMVATAQYILSIGPMSAGDRAYLLELAEYLELPVAQETIPYSEETVPADFNEI